MTCLNDPLERVYMGAHTTGMKAEGRARQTSYMNIHKAHPRSEPRIFDMGMCAQAHPPTKRPN